ncbi:armadillo-type protein [Spinellus fusiger]|nr:armadillo-type protein [Spinellus fusiger]
MLKLDYQHMENELCNTSGTVPLAKRFRVLFTLMSYADDTCVAIIAKAFNDESALLKHELAYCIGQTRDPKANSILANVLANPDEHEMVRHEAAEAIGAIGSMDMIPVLEQYLKDPSQSVVETCELAIEKIRYENNPENAQEKAVNSRSIFRSVDPAPPTLGKRSINDLGNEMMNTELSLFKRYRAMFTLREIATDEAALELTRGLKDTSALFRHEVAFVFGQLQLPVTVPALVETLKNSSEVDMVRHEAAEALGSIATPEVLEILKKFQQDDDVVVRESCVVALDMYEYAISDEFQYANGAERSAYFLPYTPDEE